MAAMATSDAHADAHLAARLATEAGHLLLQVRAQLTADGAPSWQVMDTGDMASHRFLAQALHDAHPDDAVLSEEGTEDPRRFTADRVWIVDPLDGTNEFGEPGRSDWAVHVALWERGELTAAAVSLPAHDVTFATDPAPPPAADHAAATAAHHFTQPGAVRSGARGQHPRL